MKTENRRAPSNGYSHRHCGEKFQTAITGLVFGIKGGREKQALNSFAIHIPAAVGVVVLGATLGVGWNSIAMLLLCIGLVMVTELINTSLELMAKAVTSEANDHIGAALDVASGAVLLASLVASAVGVIVFGRRLVELLGG